MGSGVGISKFEKNRIRLFLNFKTPFLIPETKK